MIPTSTRPMVRALPVSLLVEVSGMANPPCPRRLPKKRPWHLPSSAQSEGAGRSRRPSEFLQKRSNLVETLRGLAALSLQR